MKSRNRQILENIKKNDKRFRDMIIEDQPCGLIPYDDFFNDDEYSGMWSLWEEWEWEEYNRKIKKQ